MKTKRSAWDTAVIRIGRTTLLVAILAGFIPSLYLYLAYDVVITAKQMGAVAVAILLMFAPVYPIEPLAFYPVLGKAGTYMGWLAGNVSSTRAPAVILAKQVCEVEDGTTEAEICTIYSIAGTIITNIIILTLGVLIGSKIIALFPEVVRDSLNSYLLPGIFGGMLGMIGRNFLKLTIPAFFIVLGLTYASMMGFLPVWSVLAVAVCGTLALARIMYKKNML